MKKTKKKSSSGSKGKVDFSRHLRGLNKHLDKAKEEAQTSGFDEFNDGKYRMRAVEAKIGVSKNKRVQVIITWKFMDGEYKGKEKLDFEGLTEDHLPYLLKKLDAMGYDTEALENLEEDLQEIFDDIKKSKPKCKVRLKTKGEFQNLYVDGAIGEDDEDEDVDEDDEEEDDEPKKKSKKKSKKKDDDEDDDEDEDEEEEDEDSDDDEEESDDEDSDDEDEDEEDEDDDEEEEAPKKKKKGAAKKKSKSKKSDDDDEDEEEEDGDEEDDDEEEVEDEVDIVVGSVVKFTFKDKKMKGDVVALDEKAGKVTIKTDKGKTVKVKADNITSVEESPAESVPKKKKKTKK